MPAQDTYMSYNRGLNAPAADAFAVTPSDGADLSVCARAIYVGGAGDIAIVTLAGNTVVFPGVPAGTTLACSARRVRATGTTATGIVGLV